MKRLSSLLLVALLLVSCGGGGGGGSDVPFFGGIWTGSATLARNTCSLSVSQQVQGSFPHTVNQMDEEVVLDEAGGTTWRGVVKGTTGFLVARSAPTTDIGNGVFCSYDAGIAYDDVHGDNGNVIFAFVLSCARGGQQLNCEVAYTGTVQRIS